MEKIFLRRNFQVGKIKENIFSWRAVMVRCGKKFSTQKFSSGRNERKYNFVARGHYSCQGIWLLGALVLIIWRTTKHSHTVVAVTTMLVVVSEFIILAGEGYDDTAIYALPVPIMLVAVGLTARLIPSVATLATFVLIIGNKKRKNFGKKFFPRWFLVLEVV